MEAQDHKQEKGISYNEIDLTNCSINLSSLDESELSGLRGHISFSKDKPACVCFYD